MDARYRAKFPQLSDVAKKKTSDASRRYNCIAWAFNDNRKVWWPHQKGYWPIPFTQATEMEAFEAWFAADGWELTDNRDVEPGYEKVALFGLYGMPTHAARLLPNGEWTSKLGQDIDLSHGLNDLNGPEYGAVVGIYRKRVSGSPTS